MTDYEQAILAGVSSGKKSLDLVMDVMRYIGPTIFDKKIYEDTLEGLVSDKKIMEIEYVLPGMSYRIKSFYLPAGTKLEIK